MVRRFIYILLSLAVTVSAVSCLEEMEVAQPKPEGSDETILVPRVKSFTNQYITKAYSNNETKITNLALLVFNNDGALVHLTETSNAAGVSSITLNKSLLNSPEQRAKLASATVVMIANVPLEKITRVKSGTTTEETLETAKPSLSEMEQFSINFDGRQTVVTSIPTDFTGFPMIGGKKGVNLNPTADQQSAIEVGLKILYAKINFSISVAEGTENNPYEGVTPSFTLNNYSVFNASMATTLAIPEEEGKPVCDFLGNVADQSVVGKSDEATASSSYTYTTSGAAGTASGTTTLTGNNPVNFTFYVSESRYNHNSDLKDIYPDNSWLTSAEAEDVKDYNPDTDADKLNGVKYFYDDLIQQYKPKLATQSPDGAPAAGMATYVILDGSYTDYRGTVWDVKYKVYLGKDNAHNFHVDRNSEYTNLITIKGIRNRQDGAYGDGEVWIDHRINVSYNGTGADDHVTITRETLIDSHIEVRPLRVNLKSDYAAAAIYLPKYPLDSQGNIIYNTDTPPSSWGQVEEIAGNGNENWIAIENNNGKYNKGKLYCPNGKRKYFTTSLIEELYLDNNAEENGIRTDEESGDKYIQLIEDGDCAWIYFDENSTANTRRAKIDVVFFTSSGGTTKESFDIYQSGLEEFGGLHFETYEEYLHSYDSEDYQYGLETSPTDYSQQGLAWGIMVNEDQGYQLSENYIVKSSAGAEDWMDKSSRYDYGHINDFPDYVTRVKSGDDWVNADVTSNSGLEFTYRAFSKVPDMTVMNMGTRPTSAYQYCLSKNKFHEDPGGEAHQMIIRWYLPDVYEMQTILQSQTSPDFNSGAYYWSSQPSYSTSSISLLGNNYVSVTENTNSARAVTSTNADDVNLRRTEQHRIRCAYNNTGRDADMTDRVPDGLGGIIRIPMKAYQSYPTVKGYFYNWLGKLEGEEEEKDVVTNYLFPKGYDTHTLASSAIDGVYYYEIDPTLSNAWNGQTLSYYPGLTPYVVIQDGDNYVESSDLKSYHRRVKTIIGQKIPELPSNTDLLPLDYIDNTDSLSISFDKGANSKGPAYSYRREDNVSTITYTKHWTIPQYDPKDFDEESGSNIGEIQLESQSAVLIYGLYSEGSNYKYNGKTYKIKDKYTTGSFPRYKYYFVLENSPTDITIEIQDKSAKNIYDEYKQGDQYVHEGITYEIVSTRTAKGGFLNLTTYYYFTLGPTTINKTLYKYREGTGGWGTKEDPSDPAPGTPAPVVDQLELFGGNKFTITAKDGYVIQSIKVNYSGSNNVHTSTLTGGGPSDNRFLRLVQTRPTASNVPPQNMSYSGDGEIGWFKWASSGTEDVQSVTLELVTYTVTGSFNFGFISLPSSFNYIAPTDAIGYQSDFNTSIVIDSFEIRIAEASK